MSLDKKTIKNILKYESLAYCMLEVFQYIQPTLRKIESKKYPNRNERRKAMLQYDKDMNYLKRVLRQTSKLLENDYPDQIDELTDKIFDLLDNSITITD